MKELMKDNSIERLISLLIQERQKVNELREEIRTVEKSMNAVIKEKCEIIRGMESEIKLLKTELIAESKERNFIVDKLEKEIREKDKEIKEKHIYQRIQYEEDKELLLKEIFSLKEKIEGINYIVKNTENRHIEMSDSLNKINEELNKEQP